jgi:hypothetical protein
MGRNVLLLALKKTPHLPFCAARRLIVARIRGKLMQSCGVYSGIRRFSALTLISRSIVTLALESGVPKKSDLRGLLDGSPRVPSTKNATNRVS